MKQLLFKFHKILVPTDFSEGFSLSLNYAKEYARLMGSELHILHVMEPSVYPTDLGFSQVSFIDIKKQLERNAKIEFEKITTELEQENIKFVTDCLIGKPSDNIIEYVENNDIDLICIATHGRSGFQHLLFGSTTEKVLRRAKCPVLSVRIGKIK